MNDAAVDQDDLSYFGWERLDAVERIPTSAKRVLTLGCGGAATERHLVERGAEVVGFEQDPRAAAVARKHGLEIREHDLDKGVELGDDVFDAVLLLDVLEHLRDPEQVLRDCVDHLAPGSTVVVSIPNFRHYSILWSLGARGGVRYVDAGILDRTHVRLTTLRMVRDWFAATGVDEVEARHTMHSRRERLLSRLSFGRLDDLLAEQVMLVGRVSG